MPALDGWPSPRPPRGDRATEPGVQVGSSALPPRFGCRAPWATRHRPGVLNFVEKEAPGAPGVGAYTASAAPRSCSGRGLRPPGRLFPGAPPPARPQLCRTASDLVFPWILPRLRRSAEHQGRGLREGEEDEVRRCRDRGAGGAGSRSSEARYVGWFGERTRAARVGGPGRGLVREPCPGRPRRRLRRCHADPRRRRAGRRRRT